MPLGREDLALLAVAAADGAPLQPVQLQKVLFLLGKELPTETGPDYYDFQPYNYGPFDSQVYADAERLAARGLVFIDRSGPWAEYAATPDGIKHAAALSGHAPIAHDYLRRAVAWARSLSFQQLVRAIYAAYPEQRANSIFQSQS